MASRGDFERLPLIDVSGLESADLETRRSDARELDRAARSSGFFYATEHGLPHVADRRTWQPPLRNFSPCRRRSSKLTTLAARRIIAATCRPAKRSSTPARKDTKEAFDLSLDLPDSDPDYRAGNRLLGPNRWPTRGSEFSGAGLRLLRSGDRARPSSAARLSARARASRKITSIECCSNRPRNCA